jgi:hypothetical protein
MGLGIQAWLALALWAPAQGIPLGSTVAKQVQGLWVLGSATGFAGKAWLDLGKDGSFRENHRPNPGPKLPKSIETSAQKNWSSHWHREWQVSAVIEDMCGSGMAVCSLHNSQIIVAAGVKKRCIISSSGKLLRTYSLPSVSDLFAISLPSGPAVGEYNVWDASVRVRDLGGKLLWSKSEPSSVESACSIDLGPGKGQGVAITYVPPGGTSIFSGKGQLVGHLVRLGNAKSIAQVHFDKDRPAGAVIAESDIRLLGSSARSIRLMAQLQGVNAVRAYDLNGDGQDEILTYGITLDTGSLLRAYQLPDKLLWQVRAKGDGLNLDKPILVGEFAPGRHWIAVADTGGLLLFFDVRGKPMGRLRIPGGTLGAIDTIKSAEGLDDLVAFTSSGVVRYHWNAVAGSRLRSPRI